MPDAPKARRLKVLTLVDRLGTHGGAERLAMQVAERLDPARFDRTLCASRFSAEERASDAVAPALAELEEAGVRFMGLDRRSRAQLWAWRPLVSLLRRERVDVLHAHKFGSNVWGVLLGRLARVPVVIAHEHSWSFEGQPLRRLIDRHLIARLSDAFIAVSREDRRRMIEIEGLTPEDVRFIPNGIPDPAQAAGRDVRGELGIGAADPVIGTVGFLVPLKALDVLVRAAELLAPQFPGLRVLVAGDGEERPRLEALVRELGLTETVLLLGHRSDVPDLVASFDVAVCCSDSEGSPLSVLEYMEAAKPVVATRVGGVPDLIDDGVHGLLVERRDPAGLAEAVATLLRDPERARRIGERGRERRRREFAIDVMVRAFEDLYLELCSGTRCSRRNGSAFTRA
jgi:glycosyltransferase involved in cell wall biosynthesis